MGQSKVKIKVSLKLKPTVVKGQIKAEINRDEWNIERYQKQPDRRWVVYLLLSFMLNLLDYPG
ncbi:MAG TPA: hypothetical protein VF181_01570 [Balneolaceae bacterium]